jgi:hypothetical protein
MELVGLSRLPVEAQERQCGGRAEVRGFDERAIVDRRGGIQAHLGEIVGEEEMSRIG